jgi:hypothetical protein
LNSSKESFPSPSWSEETSLSNGFVEGIPYKMLDIYNTYTHIHLQDVKMEIDIKFHGISWDTNMTKNSWSRTKLATRQLIVSFKKTLLGLYQTNTVWKIQTVGVWPSQKYGKAISCFLSSHMRHLKL